MNRVKTVFAAFREMNRLEKRLIPTAVTVAFVTAVMPFINIWFTSKIIDLLDGGAGMKSLTLYIGSAVGINAVLFFVNCFLGEMQFVYRSLMYNKELREISSKLFRIEYQRLENSEFKELVHKHSEAQDRVFSSFVQFTWMMRDFISGALTLVISVVIIIPLLKIGFEKTGASFFERPAFLLTIFGAIAVMAVIILVVAVRMNKAWFKASDEYSRLDRIFYYFLNMFSDYNTGKEIRLYDVTDGEILINGTDIKEYTRESITGLYSVVFQDFKIFSVSLKDNICASSDFDSDRFYACLENANIKDRAERLADKENTYLYKDLDETGVEISGGEAQKLALARALYKDAPVVILDEPTAALDPIAENEIYSRFNSFVQNKTAIYISHRLSSCAFCDKIAVFDNARLVEHGTHRELLGAGGKYSELWNAQARYYIS